jgi:two-component system LytT family response regulator
MHTPSHKSLTVLIVDDEAPGRRRLADLLHNVANVLERIEAADGNSAVELIESRCPDAVFLDIQMPGQSGLEVVEAIGLERIPVTAFVTAYDQHAISAFEANALDYLLKPFSDERFEATMMRISKPLEQYHAAPMAAVESERWDRLVVKNAGTTYCEGRGHRLD